MALALAASEIKGNPQTDEFLNAMGMDHRITVPYDNFGGHGGGFGFGGNGLDLGLGLGGGRGRRGGCRWWRVGRLGNSSSSSSSGDRPPAVVVPDRAALAVGRQRDRPERDRYGRRRRRRSRYGGGGRRRSFVVVVNGGAPPRTATRSIWRTTREGRGGGSGTTMTTTARGIAAMRRWAGATGPTVEDDRSEERRVGKECRSRWSPYH